MKLDWRIKNKDDSEIINGPDIHYKELDRSAIKEFILQDERNVKKYGVTLQENDKVIYRRRTIQTMGQLPEVCHLVLLFTDNGNKFAWIFEETGKIVLKDKFIENSRWFREPQYFTEENMD